MQQQVGLVFDRTFQAELELRAVHRLVCLPSDDAPPAAADEQRAQFGRSGAQAGKIRMRRQGHAINSATEMPGFIVLPDVADGQHREHETFTVAQRHPVACLQFSRRLFDGCRA